MVLQEIKSRFTDSEWLYQALSAMSTSSPNFLDLETLKPLKMLRIRISKREELVVCKAYIETVTKDGNKDPNFILMKLYEQRLAFPDVYKLAAVVVTFGSSEAVCEASFSTLTRIDSPHRRSMTHWRQNNLVLLAFEKGITKSLDLNIFATNFCQEHQRCF